MELRELVLHIIGICTSTIAAAVLLWMLTQGIGEPRPCGLLAFVLAWASGIQCGELFNESR